MNRSVLSILLATFCLLSGCAAEQERKEGPLVLAASSLQEALEAAADAWQADGHPRPILSFAATSALARQIESGAPGDLFVSADEEWMDQMEAAGRLVPGTRQYLAGNRLVLIAPAGTSFDLPIAKGFPLAGTLSSGRLAMADPDSVPAGKYGKEALQYLGVWDSVATRIAVGENVRVALNLVSLEEAPLGIVYATDAAADRKVQVVGTFPAESHAPIRYPIVRLVTSSHADAAAFEAFLLSDQARAIFRRFGFETR